MPLDEAGKTSIIQDRCSIDSPDGRSLLVDGETPRRNPVVSSLFVGYNTRF
jgi:hypothetical protein